MDEFLEILSVAVVVVVAVFFSLGSILFIAERADYVSDTARIEQLRSDIVDLSGQVGEDVVGQATEWNQVIAAKKRWNQVPVLCLWIPNGWDKTELLPIPKDRR